MMSASEPRPMTVTGPVSRYRWPSMSRIGWLGVALAEAAGAAPPRRGLDLDGGRRQVGIGGEGDLDRADEGVALLGGVSGGDFFHLADHLIQPPALDAGDVTGRQMNAEDVGDDGSIAGERRGALVHRLAHFRGDLDGLDIIRETRHGATGDVLDALLELVQDAHGLPPRVLGAAEMTAVAVMPGGTAASGEPCPS